MANEPHPDQASDRRPVAPARRGPDPASVAVQRLHLQPAVDPGRGCRRRPDRRFVVPEREQVLLLAAAHHGLVAHREPHPPVRRAALLHRADVGVTLLFGWIPVTLARVIILVTRFRARSRVDSYGASEAGPSQLGLERPAEDWRPAKESVAATSVEVTAPASPRAPASRAPAASTARERRRRWVDAGAGAAGRWSPSRSVLGVVAVLRCLDQTWPVRADPVVDM